MSETERITLYAAVDSPFPHRVRLALEEAGAKYDIIWIDLLNKPEWYEQKVYPNGGRVPLLVYGGPELHPDESPSPAAAKIVESGIILEFLADLFPSAHLLPSDPVVRAHARLFAHTVDTALLPAFMAFVFLRAPAAGVLAVLDTLQGMLPPAEGYVAGAWSLADAAFVPILIRWDFHLRTGLGTFEPEVLQEARDAFGSPRFERLRKYLADNAARPSWAKCYDEEVLKEKMVQRLERFRKTGIISSDFRVPVPGGAAAQ
ncbi:hypothetical protein BV20DRAFT_1027012 [Pilatotrama ljubarskyi]|nr:hypothetical protein BV20DRAFT_1027012 [Pilatotrama ljubarskyi]